MDGAKNCKFSQADSIAAAFVAARRTATALHAFPGPIPPDLASAYDIQDAAIALWPDEIAGWKIGKIPDAAQAVFGSNRLGGPIFRKGVTHTDGDKQIDVGVFVGGTACFEAEYIFEIAADAPADKVKYTLAEAEALAGRLFVGIEMAGSPLANINGLGPHIVVSDFGNNADEIVGTEIADWRARSWSDFSVTSYIDDVKIAEGGALNIPGTPVESLQFIAENCAKRGKPLKKGLLISTGAATGVHDIVSGQRARAEFAGIQTIRVATHPRSAHNG